MVVLLNVGSPSNPSLVQVAMSFVSLSTLECYLAARKDIKGHSLKPRLKFVSQPKMRKWLRQRCQRKLWSGVPSGTQCPTCTGWNILWASGYTGCPKKVTFRIPLDCLLISPLLLPTPGFAAGTDNMSSIFMTNSKSPFFGTPSTYIAFRYTSKFRVYISCLSGLGSTQLVSFFGLRIEP